MIQVIVRAREEIGYEVVLTNGSSDQFDDLIPFVPDVTSPNPPNLIYVSKFPLNDKIVVKMAIPDEDDPYGRLVMKTHSLILSPKQYAEKGGLPYYTSPLLSGKVDTEDRLFGEEDFKFPKLSFSAYGLLEDVLTRKCVKVRGKRYRSEEIIEIFALIDYAIPDALNPQFSLLTFIPGREKWSKIADRFSLSYIFVPQAKRISKNLLWKGSKRNTIRMIGNSLVHPESRRSAHAHLMSGKLSWRERKLSRKFKNRFELETN